MRQILNSWNLNYYVYNIAKTNCLPQHSYLIWFYWWDHNFIISIKKSLYWRNNQINNDSIIRSLTK